MKPSKVVLELNSQEFAELFYSVDTKLKQVVQGAFRLEVSKDQDPESLQACLDEEDSEQIRWTKDLQKLQRKLERAAKKARVAC